MENKRIIVADPITVAGITLIPVIKSSSYCQAIGSNFFFSAIKQPMNMLVASPSTKKAFDIEGVEIPLGGLLREVPDLAVILEKDNST
jgi:hypothetical protein